MRALLRGRTVGLVAAIATLTFALGGCSSDKPDVSMPKGAAPTTLQSTDLKVGDGPAAKIGDTANVLYVGKALSTGKEFDSNWNKNDPFVFTLGAGNVIEGWDRGVNGMKVGGRRQLVIPPDLGYGTKGSPPAIKPNETLVFVVELIGIS